MSALANSEDSDKMPHNAAFQQGLHCLLKKQNNLHRKKHIFEIKACDPSLYTTDHSKFFVSNKKEESICA